MITIELENNIHKFNTKNELTSWLMNHGYRLTTNGTIVKDIGIGVIPQILDKWFADRIIFKNLMKQHKKDGNSELADYYDRRQHVQKILLNSIYGVLGLPIFRFYDLDNALAVTATGQDVIKTTAKFANTKYTKVMNNDVDYCIYIDTDSVYFPAGPLFDKYPEELPLEKTVAIAKDMERNLNLFYDTMAHRLFFCNTHRFVIKGEAISKTAFWVAKKRYAMWKVYDLEANTAMKPKLAVKGLDVVRSSFPPAFQKFMSECLTKILDKGTKQELDNMVLEFREQLNGMDFKQVARNTSINDMSNDNKKETGFTNFPKGATAHQKAAIAYNRWLRINKIDKQYGIIRNGDKIKYVNLKPNPKGIITMALKGQDDPPELVEYVNKYMDYDTLFEKELKNKLLDFYTALNFGMLPTDVNQSVSKFFEF